MAELRRVSAEGPQALTKAVADADAAVRPLLTPRAVTGAEVAAAHHAGNYHGESMRARLAGLIVVLLALLAACVPAAAAGLDPTLCRPESGRVSIPRDFVLDACFNGRVLYVRNTTELVVTAVVTGGIAAPRRTTPTAPATASAFIAAGTPQTVLPPGFGLEVPVGDAAAQLRVIGHASNPKYVLARVLSNYLPNPFAAYQDFSELLDGLQQHVRTVAECFMRSNVIGDAGCALTWTWNATRELSKYALHTGLNLGKGIRAGVASEVLKVIEAKAWAEAAIQDVRLMFKGSTRLDIRAAQPAATSPPATTPRPGPRPAPPSHGATPPAPPPANPPPATPVTHYDCANDNSNLGHYIRSGTYWQEAFTAQGSRVLGGWVLIGAHQDGGDHRARIGIYGGPGLSAPLGSTVVNVGGYDGESFQLSAPVTKGQQVYLAVSGIGDFTAYDSRAGCFIAHVTGTG
jgi:hypothetical protein